MRELGGKGRVYPRVCGGTCHAWPPTSDRYGLSPRVRGNPPEYVTAIDSSGSIPACAGEPLLRRRPCIVHSVYPRVCGGTRRPPTSTAPLRGLSPRVRGNQCSRRGKRARRRSIPACAGEPASQDGVRRLPAVYPRVCGGTASLSACEVSSSGLSPRVRGNQNLDLLWIGVYWSIPACAGEPPRVKNRLYVHEVYPRVCGGTAP